MCALAHVQGNDPERALSIVARSGARAHPADLGVARADFDTALLGLRAYARAEGLDIGVADLTEIGTDIADAAWAFVQRLPREEGI